MVTLMTPARLHLTWCVPYFVHPYKDVTGSERLLLTVTQQSTSDTCYSI